MNNPENPITINDKQYQFEDMPEEAQVCVRHITSLDAQLNELKFRMDQLQVGRAAFIARLNVAIEGKPHAA